VPFPWSLTKLPVNISPISASILLIGHVRPSKGIDFLLEAYPKYKSLGGNLELTVAGSMSSSVRKNIVGIASNLIDKTLDDQQFLDLISAAMFLIMPYRQGYSNSSIHYCALVHCSTPFICSDIELFDNFEHGVDCLKFQYGDSDSFASTLRLAEQFGESDRKLMAANALMKIKSNMQGFDIAIGKLFEIGKEPVHE
jgi:glycosyltransferase involved in cell wall biosynthesis